MSGTIRRTTKNLLSLSGAQILSQMVSFAVIVYLARTLGVANFGKIGFAQALVLYFSLGVNLGLTVVGVRSVARKKLEMERYASHILTLRLTLAVLFFFLLGVTVILIPQPAEVKYLIMLYGLSLFPSALLLDWLFQGLERMEFIGIARIMDKLLYGGLVFLVVRSSQQLLVIPFLWLAGSLLASSFLIYTFIRRLGNISFRFDFPFWKKLLRQALPMGAAFVMIQIYYHFDMVMLGFMKGDKVVGLYNAAYKVIFFVWALIPVFINVIFPLMSRYYKESVAKLRILISSSTRLLSIVALPLGIGGTILARPIMNFLYGPQYLNGVIAFQILIWSVVIICVRCTYEQSFLACDEEKRYLYGVAIGAVTNITLNILLIPRFDIRGAAVATVISEFVFSFYMLLYFRVISRIKIVGYLAKPLLAASIMGLIVYYFRDRNLFFSVSIGTIAYFVSILLLKGITFEEIIQLKRQITARV